MKIENKKITAYTLYLQEKYRPPSRGGNTAALHSHVVEIEGKKYSFLALGSQQWIFKGDTVSFEYELNGAFKNIKPETIVTWDKNQKEVVRGNRGYKPHLRTADTRLPGSRREQKD